MASTFRCENSGGQITLSAGPTVDNETTFRLTVFGLADNGGTQVPLDRRGLEWLRLEVTKRLELLEKAKPSYDLTSACRCGAAAARTLARR